MAAALARNSIISRFDGDKHLNAQHIRDYVQTANRTILSEQQAVQDYRRMGTTLVSLFIDRDYGLAYWAHAGDSRLYLFRRGWLWHVTTDHSPVQQMKDAGHQTDNLNSNLLYLALGIENGGPEASYSDVVQVEDGDAFTLHRRVLARRQRRANEAVAAYGEYAAGVADLNEPNHSKEWRTGGNALITILPGGMDGQPSGHHFAAHPL